MSSKQSGFTLIELVVVIVIIGILAAAALPRFVDLTGEARKSAAQGLAGSLSGAAALVKGKYEAQGGSPDNIDVGGTQIGVTDSGYPEGDEADLTGVLQQDPTDSGNWIYGTDGNGTQVATSSSGIAFETTGGNVIWEVRYDPGNGVAAVSSRSN